MSDSAQVSPDLSSPDGSDRSLKLPKVRK